MPFVTKEDGMSEEDQVVMDVSKVSVLVESLLHPLDLIDIYRTRRRRAQFVEMCNKPMKDYLKICLADFPRSLRANMRFAPLILSGDIS